jgi:hypothetical protein
MKTILVLPLTLVAGFLHGQVLTSNLLVNPGGETGDLTGWAVGGPVPPLVASTNTSGYGTVLPHSGRFVFKGGPNPDGFLQQRVLLAAHGITSNQVGAGELLGQ